MSGADDVLFGRAELERAFTRLGQRLQRCGVVADLFIVGGAAMALAYDATRVTRDVDAVFVPHPGLRVMAASTNHIFAMKALAARTRDADDLRILADLTGVSSLDEALDECARFYPDEQMSPVPVPCSASFSM